MSIASEISRLQTDKEAMRQAIINKGVDVGAGLTLDEYAACIAEIEQGGVVKYANIDLLVVAGGGGGGGTCAQNGSPGGSGGGGGGGGVIYCPGYLLQSSVSTYNIIVGEGGAGILCKSGSNGCMSCFGNITVCGGGGGGLGHFAYGGNCGGSGGGGGSSTGGGGLGVSGQGCGGGGAGGYLIGGGGGGASAAGDAGNAGIGYGSNISGTLCYYGSGGGAGGYCGCCGGGNGGAPASLGVDGNDATYYGGGGGGAYGCSTKTDGTKAGGAGYQGIVILRYKTDGSCGISNLSRGGTKYTCGDYTIHCFTNTSNVEEFIPVFK